MKTSRTPEAFSTLVERLEAQARYAASFPEHAQPEMVSLVPLIRLVAMSVRRQQEEEARVRCRVFRFSTDRTKGHSYSPPCRSSGSRAALRGLSEADKT